MSASAIPECTTVDALVLTDHAVHLILRVSGNWESDRDRTVADLEQRIAEVCSFATSAVFRQRFGARIGVIRVQPQFVAPSIVVHLLTEQGIELEQPDAAHPEDGPSCVECPRQHLNAEQAAMTDHGWACPACFRAWNVRSHPQMLQKPRRWRIPQRLLWPLVIFVMAFYAFVTFYKLQGLSNMNRVIRQHIPTE